MLGIGVLAAGVDVATANNTVAIVMTGELAKDISREYGIEPSRPPPCWTSSPLWFRASSPDGAQLLYCFRRLQPAPMTSFAIVPYCFYPMLMAVCGVVYILIQKKA